MGSVKQQFEFARAIRIIRKGGPRAEEAFSMIFRQYANSLRVHVYKRMGDSTEADDIVQDSFIKLLSAIRQGRSVRHASYLWSIADGLIIDRHRSQTAAVRNQQRNTGYDDESMLESSLHSESPSGFELMECIQGSLEKFSTLYPEHVRVIELAVVEEWSIPELASYLDRTRSATRQYLYECRKKLRSIVTERCGELL